MIVKLITDYQQFLKLEQEWNGVVDRNDERIFWFRHEQLRIWFETFGQPGAVEPRNNLFILLVYDGEELVAIAPLMKTAIKVFGMTINAICFMGYGRSDLIILRDKEEVLNLLLSYLRGVRYSWLDFRMIPRRSEQARLIENMTARKKLLARMAEPDLSYKHLYIPATPDWDQYEKTLSKNFRSNINKAERQLNEIGKLEYECICPVVNLEAVIDKMMQVELNSWRMDQGDQVLNLTGGILFDYATRFLHESAKQEYLRIYFLKLDNAPIAYDVSVSYKNHYMAIWGGYDLKYRQYSPGQLLMRHVLKTCFETKHEQYDFLGYFEYETRWTNSFLQHEDIRIYKNRIMYALDTWLFSRPKSNGPQPAKTMRDLQS